MKTLIIHPGAGKTGTTSIQRVLQNEYSHLLGQGIGYLGMSFENTSADDGSSESDKQLFPLKHKLGREIRNDPGKMAEVCSNRINNYVKANPGVDTLVWSNESLVNQHGWFDLVRGKLQGISEIKTIYGIRDPSKWFISAYFQWGGSTDFKEFVLKRSLAGPGKAWATKSDKFQLLDIDNCDDPINAFLGFLSGSLSPVFDVKKLNTTTKKSNFSEQKKRYLANFLSADETLCRWIEREEMHIKRLRLLIK